MGNAILLQFTGKNNPRQLGGGPGSRQIKGEYQIKGGQSPMGILARKQRIRNTSYILPDIISSYEELQRFNNLDLQEFDLFSLWQELYKVKTALAQLDLRRQPWLFTGPGQFIPACKWLRGRYKAVKEELNRRERKGA